MAIKNDNDIIQEDYTIDLSVEAVDQNDGSLPDTDLIIPFRFFQFSRLANIRQQNPANAYKTFLGEQKS